MAKSMSVIKEADTTDRAGIAVTSVGDRLVIHSREIKPQPF